MPKILFIDDDVFSQTDNGRETTGDYMWYYQEAIREVPGYEVMSESSTDAALKAIQENTFDLIVLDIMMDPGECLKDNRETRGGLCTGLVLARKIHDTHPSMKMILLSNAVAPEAPQKGMANELEAEQIVCEVFYKPKTLPFHFRDIVIDTIKGV